MKIIFLFLCMLIAKFSFAQQSKLDSLLLRVSLVQAGSYSGSGFFLFIDDNIVFVTAKHVIINEQVNDKNQIERAPVHPLITIITYPKNIATNSPDSLVIDFEKAAQMNGLRYSLVKDVAIIFIAKVKPIANNNPTMIIKYEPYTTRLNKGTWMNFFQPGEFQLFDSINIGTDIYMGGYPKSLGLANNKQYNFDRPLLRKGAVAGKAYELGNIIVDCPSYGGNSGGPICVENTTISDDKIVKDYKLIGLVSGFVPFNEVWYNQNYRYTNVDINNSGFSEIVPIDFVIQLYLDLLKNLK